MKLLENAWYRDSRWLALLKPFTLIFSVLGFIRRSLYKHGLKKTYTASVPVIVVGNISVGGTGKTPLIILLARKLKAAGYNPGIASRGYGSRPHEYPYSVDISSTPEAAGDEALLLAQNLNCPIVIDPKRVSAVQYLERQFNCDVILSDDGLQHYAMGRHIEIAVIDGKRMFGNKRLLPEGPLRESVSRLQSVDFVVCNGHPAETLPVKSFEMRLYSVGVLNLKTHDQFSEHKSKQRPKVHAVAGIGNPERFFTSLCASGFDIISHIYPDHHRFSPEDITFDDDLDVVMTEKDAVKCREFATNKHWFLKVEARTDEFFILGLLEKLAMITE